MPEDKADVIEYPVKDSNGKITIRRIHLILPKGKENDLETVTKLAQDHIKRFPTIESERSSSFTKSKNSLKGTEGDIQQFGQDHPVVKALSDAVGYPIKGIMENYANRGESKETDPNTGQDLRPGYRQAIGGAADTASTGMNLLGLPSIIRGGIRGLWPVVKGIAGYSGAEYGTEKGLDALGVPPEVSRGAGIATGLGAGALLSGASPRMNDTLSGGYDAAVDTPVTIRRTSVPASLGFAGGSMLARMLGLPTYGGGSLGAVVGAKAGPFFQGAKAGYSKGAPWLDPGIMDSGNDVGEGNALGLGAGGEQQFRPVPYPTHEAQYYPNYGSQPTDIHPVTKAEGQSAYSRPRLGPPDQFGEPARTQGAIPIGPETPGRPTYPPGTAPEVGSPANVNIPQGPLQLGQGNVGHYMPPSETGMQRFPTDWVSGQPAPQVGTTPMWPRQITAGQPQGLIGAGEPVHQMPPAGTYQGPENRVIQLPAGETAPEIKPVTKGPVKPTLKKVTNSKPKAEPIDAAASEEPTPESVGKKLTGEVKQTSMKKKEQPQPRNATALQDKKPAEVKEMKKPEDKQNTVTSPEINGETPVFSRKDIYDLADQLGVHQATIDDWLTNAGHDVEASLFPKRTPKRLNIRTIGPRK